MCVDFVKLPGDFLAAFFLSDLATLKFINNATHEYDVILFNSSGLRERHHYIELVSISFDQSTFENGTGFYITNGMTHMIM